MKRLGRKGISTIAGAVLFVILIFALQTTLFLTVYRYNSSVQDSIKTENERIQEKIVLSSLLTDILDNVYALMVNNTGAITVRIRAIYIDNQFLCDPSDPSINPGDTYINAKETVWVLMPLDVKYNPTSKITVTTERGTKSTDYEWRLKQGGGGRPPYEPHKFYLGPLMLDFIKFYFAEVNPQTGAITSEWRPGWYVNAGMGPIAWNITVKNIDDRDITINQFCVFTLVPNDQPSNRRPWYIEPPINALTQRINANQTVQLIYKWTTPRMNWAKNPNTQSIYTTVCRNRIFLTFFGIFHEHDGTTKPYGQTIPFEAVLVEKPTSATVQVTASPNALPIKSTRTSTITATVLIGAKPVVGANLTFTTTAGNLSSSWVITDTLGKATVTLTARWVTSPTNATVTATWIGISGSTTVLLTAETIQLTALPTVIPVGSAIKSTITATARIGTNPLVGANLTFTTTAGSLSASWAITDATGTAKVFLTAGVNPATATVTASWINTSNSTTVLFALDTVTLTASPTVIVIKSKMNSTITAQVTRNGNPVVGANLTFTTTAGDLYSPWAITDTNGIARVNLTARWWTTTGDATVTAKWTTLYGSKSGSTTVRLRTETIQVTASPTVIVVNSAMKSTITAVVTVDANPVVGANLTFSTNAGSLSPSWAITDVSGIARVNLTAGSTPATATVSATWINTLGSATVSFVVETIQITASPTVIATNSTMNSTITAIVKVGANPVSGANVTFATNASDLSSLWAITDADGEAKVYLNTLMTPAVANVTATWINTSSSTTVRFTNLYVATDKTSYAPNETVRISGLLRDLSGAPIQGVNVTIDIVASNGTVIWSLNATTDSNGAFTYDLDLQLINAKPDIYTVLATYQTYEERYHTFEVTE